MMLFTLLLVAWPVAVIIAAGFAVALGIKYLNKKNAEKKKD